jgi:membrane associated rhomboid family serine protease
MELLLWVLTLVGAWHAGNLIACVIDGLPIDRHIFPAIIGLWALWLICFA